MSAPFLALLLLLQAAPAAWHHPVEQALAETLRTDANPVGFTLVFDDVHPLYGGALFELGPDGVLTRTDVLRGDQEPVVSRVRLGDDQVTWLLSLLLGLEVWQQRVPDRVPLPDESRAFLGVRLNGAEAAIWEWSNDLGANRRLAQVQKWLDVQLPAGAP